MVNTLQSQRGLREKVRKKRQEPGMQAMEGRRLGPPVHPLPLPLPLHTITTTVVKKKRYCVVKIKNKAIMVEENNAVLIRLVDIFTK